jgi:preprotein translocase subunit SecG
MTTVLLVVHLMVVIALVAVVLLQRSEGGALGIGGGGGFMTSRGTANVLTRATAILAAVFFATSMALSILPRFVGGPTSILDTVPGAAPVGPAGAPVGGTEGGVLDDLQRLSPGAQTPPATTPGAQTPAPAEAPAPATGETPAAPATTTPPAQTPAQ